MPVRTWRAHLWARLRGSAGVNQSATVAGLVAAALAVTLGIVPFAPQIGSAVGDLFICEIGQSGADQCVDTGPGPGRGRGLQEGDVGATPAWYQPGYNSTVYTGPPPLTVPETSGAGGVRPVDGAPTSMDWCSVPSDSSVSTIGSLTGWTSTQFWSTSNYCVDPAGQLRDCTITHSRKWFNFIPLGTTDNDLGCSNAVVSSGSMACTAAGVSPPQWTCQLRGDASGRMFHCVEAAYGLSCTDTNHDTERALTGIPVSCSDNSFTQGLPGDLGRACLGPDGTLYYCQQDGLGGGPPPEGGCPSRALPPGIAGLTECVPVDGGVGVQCTYTGVDPSCTAGPACPVQRTSVRCAVSQADGSYNHCQDTGGLAPSYLGNGSVCEQRDPDGTCSLTTPVPLYSTGPPDHVTSIDDDLDITVSPDLVQRGQVPNPVTGATSSYADAVAACTGNEVTCQNQVASDLDDTEATLAGMLSDLGLCSTQQECVNPNSPNGRKLQQWYRDPKKFSLAWTAGSVLLLTGLNSVQFQVSSVHFALAGGVGAAIFTLMLAIDKAKTRLSNRLWPANAAVDVATLNAAVAAAVAPLRRQIDDLIANNLVDQGALVAQIADLENQLHALQPHQD